MPKFKLDPAHETVTIEHIECNEKIGKISVDGQVNGRYVAVVFRESDIPKGCNSEAEQREYIKLLLQAEIKESE